MAKFPGSDFITVLRGLNAVSKAAINITEKELKEAWSSSSIRSMNNLFNESAVFTKQTGDGIGN